MSEQTAQRQYSIGWIMLLALLTALGPLSIDMYLPALPQMAHDFGVSTQNGSKHIAGLIFWFSHWTTGIWTFKRPYWSKSLFILGLRFMQLQACSVCSLQMNGA